MPRSASASLAAHALHVLRGHACFFPHACDKRGRARKSRYVFCGASICAGIKSTLGSYTGFASCVGVSCAPRSNIAPGGMRAPMRYSADIVSAGRHGRISLSPPEHVRTLRSQCHSGCGSGGAIAHACHAAHALSTAVLKRGCHVRVHAGLECSQRGILSSAHWAAGVTQ